MSYMCRQCGKIITDQQYDDDVNNGPGRGNCLCEYVVETADGADVLEVTNILHPFVYVK